MTTPTGSAPTERHGHFREVCRHGTIVTQCRCIGPKADRIVACPSHCKAPKAAAVDDATLDKMNAPARVRRCVTHHACDCLGWMAAQYRKGIDGLDDGMNLSIPHKTDDAARNDGLSVSNQFEEHRD